MKILALPIALLALSLSSARAYKLESIHWPAGADIVLQLGLGGAPGPLQDGFADWNAVAADALATWDSYVDFISVSGEENPIAPRQTYDGVNSVWFDATILGESFGPGTLAVTLTHADAADFNLTTEADVIVNSAFSYDSYRGSKQAGLYDMHRILLHEFGHVLGLAHNPFAPLGTKIMEPVISNLDHPRTDDIAGVRFLYGANFERPQVARTLRIGQFFSDTDAALNDPTSYTAIGLPPGVTLDSRTGTLTGRPTKTGVFGATLTAHGPIANAYASYQITVLSLEELPGLAAVIDLPAKSMVADPLRNRVYFASGTAGVNMVNTDTLEVTNLRTADVQNAQLSLSADGSRLFYTVPLESAFKEYRIDLDTFQVLPGITIPAHHTAVFEGLNNQAYVASKTSILQFNATTGTLEKAFYEHPPLSAPPYLAISPDRQLLYAWTDDAFVSVYDISGTTPTYISSLPIDFPVFSPDGRYVYSDSRSSSYIVYQAPLPEGNPSTEVFPLNLNITRGLTSVGLNGLIYQSFLPKAGVTDKSGSIGVYDPETLKELFNIHLGDLQQGDLAPYLPLQTISDRSGKYFFTEIQEGDAESLWIFAPELLAEPPLAHPTKNLLNVSTRTLVQAGEDAMIGGFIIQGPGPKKVLIRGLGPSVPNSGAMLDPHLDLYDSSGRILMSNDDWVSDRVNVVGTGLPPASERESAIVLTLQPGAYTAVLRDAGGHSGLALVEIYDLAPEDSLLANISTRGTVKLGDNVMIGGFIVGGANPTKVLVRAIGPSLAGQGISEPLSDPVLELHNGNGALISTNNDWRSDQEADIAATGIPPTKDKESAILATLSPGNYTAIVRGQSEGTGVALVEIYNLDAVSSSGN